MKLLGENRDKLDLLAGTLLEREVLDGADMDRLLRGEKLAPPRSDRPTDTGSPTPVAVEPEPEREKTPGPFAPPAPRPAGA
jgi:hypothetical protein